MRRRTFSTPRSASPTCARDALPCTRAQCPAPPEPGRLVKRWLAALPFLSRLLPISSGELRPFLEFYQVRERLFEPFTLPCGAGTRMAGVTFNRNRAKLKKLLGIRARLALLAVLLVAPLMLERVRSLDEIRTKQIAAASEEFANLTQHSADTQREVISSVETMLKSAAYIRASGGIARSCEILRASLPTNLPWIRSIMIAAKDGLVQCSTLNMQVGLNLADRDYFRKAQQTRDFVFSDYLFGKSNGRPMMMAAYPVAAINPEEEAVVVAGINIDWLSKIMNNIGGRPGISSLLVDSTGIVIAAPSDQASMIGRPLDNVPLLAAIAEKALSSDA